MNSNEILEKLITETHDLHNFLVSLRKEKGTFHELDRDSVRHRLRGIYDLSTHLIETPVESRQSVDEVREVQAEEPEMHVEIMQENHTLQTAINAVLEAVAEPTTLEFRTHSPAEMELAETPPAILAEDPALRPRIENASHTLQTTVTETPTQKTQTADSDTGKSIADRFTPSKTVGDMIQQNQPIQRVSDKLRSKSLSDLHESIGINERFSFINQLFKGDQVRYFEAISKLNELQSMEEALGYLNQELLPLMAWKNPPTVWKEFVDLVSRRYQG